MKIRHFLLLVVVLLSSWTIGCAPARSGQEYLTTGGCGEVTGEMSGVSFTAEIELMPNRERVRVTYLAPETLRGLVLLSDGETCEVTLGELSFSCKACEVAGFLRPVTVFLTQGEASSVQREGENTVLTYPTGEVLTLSPSGEPISLAREDIKMRVVWWQTGGVEGLGS